MTHFSQSDALTILTHAPADAVKALAEALIPQLGDIAVLVNRTGLVMLPYTDSAGGATFHLGEVLVSEAHVRIADDVQGYALVMGRDLVFALACALIDAAYQTHIETEKIDLFLNAQQKLQQDADTQLLQQVEQTRVEMETF
ncbi:MAG: phosphonate C-P lyase system protein PhnG [Chloroflexota bacterium]|nr:phosphonate C-P lyase system protein PhnG [Chloroflexota bacterium]